MVHALVFRGRERAISIGSNMWAYQYRSLLSSTNLQPLTTDFGSSPCFLSFRTPLSFLCFLVFGVFLKNET